MITDSLGCLGSLLSIDRSSILASANIILASRRKEHANNERHRYHSAFSIDVAEYEDKEYFCTDDDLADDIIEDEFEIKRKELPFRQ